MAGTRIAAALQDHEAPSKKASTLPHADHPDVGSDALAGAAHPMDNEILAAESARCHVRAPSVCRDAGPGTAVSHDEVS